MHKARVKWVWCYWYNFIFWHHTFRWKQSKTFALRIYLYFCNRFQTEPLVQRPILKRSA